MKRSFLFPALILMSALPLTTAYAADATSFNPTTVKVTAKPISSIPVGTIISWPVAQNPADWQNPDGSFNWLECNGQSISKSAYPELFALMGGQVPDLRGLFLRGYGSQSHTQQNGSSVGVTSTTHTSGALGHVQGDAARRVWGDLAEQIQQMNPGEVRAWGAVIYRAHNSWASGNHQEIQNIGWRKANTELDTSLATPTDNENRPVNMAVRYLVRARP